MGRLNGVEAKSFFLGGAKKKRTFRGREKRTFSNSFQKMVRFPRTLAPCGLAVHEDGTGTALQVVHAFGAACGRNAD